MNTGEMLDALSAVGNPKLFRLDTGWHAAVTLPTPEGVTAEVASDFGHPHTKARANSANGAMRCADGKGCRDSTDRNIDRWGNNLSEVPQVLTVYTYKLNYLRGNVRGDTDDPTHSARVRGNTTYSFVAIGIAYRHEIKPRPSHQGEPNP